ncbi:MAG: hypothetical protein V7K82_19070 [Nostoc sp.]
MNFSSNRREVHPTHVNCGAIVTNCVNIRSAAEGRILEIIRTYNKIPNFSKKLGILLFRNDFILRWTSLKHSFDKLKAKPKPITIYTKV